MKLQLSLANILLLVTAVAIGVSLWIKYDRNRWYEGRLPGLRNAARELNVNDLNLLHAVAPHPEWFDEKKWEIFVPENGKFWIHAATEKVPADASSDEPPDVESSFQLSPGRHTIELRINRAKRKTQSNEVEVLIDEKNGILIEKVYDWYPVDCSCSSSVDIEVSKSYASGENARLIRREFRPNNMKNVTNTHFNGVFLWISEDSGNGKN